MDIILGLNEHTDEDDGLHVNITCAPTHELATARDAEAVINVIVFLVGGPVNLLVFITQLLSNRVYKTSTPTLYMTNLYFCNMLTLTVLPFILLSNRGAVGSTPEGCKLAALMYYTSSTAGFANLALISINRYRTIHQRTNRTTSPKKQTYTVLVASWLASLTCAIPATMFTTVLAHDTDNDMIHETCIMFFSYDQIRSSLIAFKILICVLWGIAPVAMMTWFYVFFYRRIKLTTYRRRSHTLKFVCTLILSFLIIQTPFVSISIFDIYAVLHWDLNCNTVNSRDAVSMLARVIPNFHCMLNPILYAFLGRDFKKRFIQFVTGKLFSRRRMLQERAGVCTSATHQTGTLNRVGAGTLSRQSRGGTGSRKVRMEMTVK